MAGPAIGPAKTLAGMLTSGSEPNTASWTGSTPTWALSVAARAKRSHDGPHRSPEMGRAPTTMAAVAATES